MRRMNQKKKALRLSKIIPLLFLLFIISTKSFSQALPDSVNWLSIEEAGKLFQETQKPILIYLYEDKNDSCRMMEKETFSNTEVSNYINVLFYAVKINVATTDTLTFFDGKSYANSKKTGNTHDLITVLGANKNTCPSFVMCDREAKGSIFQGFKDRDAIFRMLIYYNENIGKSTEYESWEKYHIKGYPPGQEQIMTRLIVKWNTLDEAVLSNKSHPRKMILNMYNYNRISCTLMRTTTFNDPTIAKYLNENFYPVNIDIFTQDTLQIFGQTYINENKPYKYHQLPIAALDGKMSFPAFIIIDENGKVLEKVRRYATPEDIEPILHFYGSNAYKTTKWPEYLKNFKSKLPVEE